MNSDDSEDEDVKSTAVVKYSVPKPAQFTKLKCNTDLNLPPSNWLSNSAESYGLQQVLYQHKGFSSFRMAHLFPDCVGDVDVVSDSENIKKLLKIPYNKGHISMMVHRVENTLLLDDFNIYKHLLRTAETEWEWLRKFFCENVESKVIDDEKTLYIRNKKIKALQQKSLISKFLYHSLGQNTERVDFIEDTEPTHKSADEPNSGHSLRGNGDVPLLPDPSPNQSAPKSTCSDQNYNRNVVWTFEDISMLIGTDLPIFGGGTHPCISLRLREMNQPINVLTGIDYWLDNLMSNVPELAMCYHLNGIVQKYELVKTEDLPSMENSKFSPKLIRDVAQSILSFLKSNATKAGHTYWLFKGKNEEVVKLYDLTSLCANDAADANQNPFIVPVAMLLYRVARNMKHSNSKSCRPTVRMLLRNAIRLLDGEKHAEIVTSAHYMLSDVYVPADTNPDEPESLLLDDQADDDEDRNSVEGEYDATFEEEEENEDSPGESDTDADNVPMKVLSLASNYPHPSITNTTTTNKKTPPPLPTTVEERCVQSISHIAAGLNCLQYIEQEDAKDEQQQQEEQRRKSSVHEETVRMADCTKPIPMPYSPLKKRENSGGGGGLQVDVKKDRGGNGALLVKSNGDTQAWRADISWKEHLKTILYEKAILVYTTLSEYYLRNCNYGKCLRCLALLVRCLHILAKLNNSPRTLEGNSIIASRAGDCCILLVKNWISTEVYTEQVHKHCEQDLLLLEQIEQDEQLFKINLADSPMKYVLVHDIRTVEQVLLQAVNCYQHACLVDDSNAVLKRLGNCYNEVGTFHLNCAKAGGGSNAGTTGFQTTDEVRSACARAEPYLRRALDVFERVRDESNVALVCSNLGHMHRILVYVHTPKERGPLTAEEKVHFNKAIQYYKRALQILGERKHNSGIWDAVNWELSSALFTLATILHEHTADKSVDNEKAVIETFQKVLQYCDFTASPDLLPVYERRAGTVYYRLGSIHHKAIYDATCSDQKRKRVLQLAKVNYEKGAKLFAQCADVIDYLTLQNQYWALTEYLVESSTSLHMKLKHQQHCLQIIVTCNEVIDLLVSRKVNISEEDSTNFKHHQNTPIISNYTSLLLMLKQRLQATLKNLVKLCLAKPLIQKECTDLLGNYKRLYSLSLSLEHETEFFSFLTKLNSVLCECEKICDE